MSEAKVDISGWNKKVDKLLREYGPVVEKIVAYGNTKVSASVNKNLSGMSPGTRTSKSGRQYVVSSKYYYPGKLPVRRITGTLARAYQISKVTPYLYLHKMNSNVANYARYVHDGTRYLKPRPYFKNAFTNNRVAIMNYWRYQFILEIRKTGRA